MVEAESGGVKGRLHLFRLKRVAMQAHATRYLWRPMSIVLIVCIWSLVLCNGKRTMNAFPRPLCIFLISPQNGVVLVFLSK